MSSALGLAATSATLQQVLTQGFIALKLDDVLGANPGVVCIAPDRVDGQGGVPQLNIVLYNQTRNPGWTQQDLPSRDARGERIANPSLALDLHYLLTAYGTADFQAEILLGAAMQILHDTPALGREAIREALQPAQTKPDVFKHLALAGLADQVEQLRIAPMNLTTDEVSRIWSALNLPARPAAAYQVSVLLSRTPRSQRTPLPITRRNAYVLTLTPPRVDRVEADADPSAPILPASLLRVRGAHLKASPMSVLVNGIDFNAGLQAATAEHLLLGLLIPGVPASLRAGLCALQVVHPQLMGSPPQSHSAVESNPGAFVLNPQVGFTVDPGGSDEVIDGVTYRNGSVTVACVPQVGVRQRVRLLLNEKQPPADRVARAYSFDAPQGNGISPPGEATGSVRIALRRVLPGSYLVRLQVDAGMSPLTRGADGRFDGPELTP